MRDDWSDLADDELLARLLNRGVHFLRATDLVLGRDAEPCAEILDELLR